MRILVLSGQFAWLFSAGMLGLAKKLEPYGEVTTHTWNDQTVVGIANNHAGPLAVIGYSLGANQLGYISANARREFQLGVAIDPSRNSPLCWREGEDYVQRAPRFQRLVCFYNPGTWLYGGSKYVGSNVRLVPINTYHLLAQTDATVQSIVVEEVKWLKEKSNG